MTAVACKHSWLQQFDGEPVVQWRAKKLLEAGYSEPQAAWLAWCKHVDYHDAVELLHRVVAAGGTVETAFDIAAE